MFGYVGAAISGVGLGYITDNYGWAAMYGACIAACVLAGLFTAFTWNKEAGH